MTDNFIPVRMHVKSNPEEFARVGELLGVASAATAAIVGPDGIVLDRIEGFVVPEEFKRRAAPFTARGGDPR